MTRQCAAQILVYYPVLLLGDDDKEDSINNPEDPKVTVAVDVPSNAAANNQVIVVELWGLEANTQYQCELLLHLVVQESMISISRAEASNNENIE